MFRTRWAYLLAAVVVVGALSCNSSQPRQEPAPELASMSIAERPLTGARCPPSCLDIHLGDYNLFLLEDYAGGCNVEGKVAVGGNIHMNGYEVGSKLSVDNFSNALVAGGTLNLEGCGFQGDAWYGRGDEDSLTFPDSVVCGHTPCTATRGNPIDFAARSAQWLDLSSRLSTQPSQLTPQCEYGVMYLEVPKDSCLSVFEVDASKLDGLCKLDGLWKWDLTGPADSLLVLNIHGEAPTIPANIEFHGGLTAQRVLYNVVEATHFSIHDNSGFSGTLLAPHASITVRNGSWSGGIYAASMICEGGFSLDNDPLEEIPGKAEETCNGVDDNCDGRVDEGFECTGSGTQSCTAWCGAEGTKSCIPATCSYDECRSSSCCRADTECGGGSYCEGTTCAALKGNGAACGSAHECASGECVDGVCCDTACTGACDACNLVGHVGTCSLSPPTVECRAPGGQCDVAEHCTGHSAACPADAVVSAGTTCRAASGLCDVAEVCDGSSKACPGDGYAPDGTNCGTSLGDWGNCGGFSDYCSTTGAQSRTVTVSTCEAGTCGSPSTRTETQACTRVPPGPQPCPEPTESWDSCGGFNGICGETGTQSHSKTAYSYNCATGLCDAVTVNETVACTRSTVGVRCRDAADTCDVAEYCYGGSCPSDGKEPEGTACGAGMICSVGGMCGSGCWIGGVSYAAGVTNPAAECEECNPSVSTSSWSAKASGAACTSDDDACTSDVCNGEGTCSHPLVAAGTSCGEGLICDAMGQCGNACWIGGKYYAAGASNPSAECQQCNPSVSTSSWSAKAVGATCGPPSSGAWGDCAGFSDTCDETGSQSRTVTVYACTSSGTCAGSNSSETQACTRSTGGTSCGTSYGAWGSCGGFSDYCATTGTQSRTVTASTCEAGTCSATGTSTQTQACTRAAPDTNCAAPSYGAWSACSFSDACAQTGTKTRTVTSYEYSCASGQCVASTSTETQTCTRNTNGISCATPSYGAWSSCSGYSDTCDETGSRSRSFTLYTCSNGTCAASSDTQTQECTRDTDGTSCGTSYGAWGSCGGFSDYCDATGTQSRTVTASTCEAGTCSAASTSTQAQACNRVAPGPQACPTSYGSWSACGGFSDFCSTTGTQYRQVTNSTYDCSTGVCSATSSGTETQSCTRTAPGPQPCAATSYGAWSACSATDFCGHGTQSRTVTSYSYSCASGQCVASTSTETQACTATPGVGYKMCNGQCVFTSGDEDNCGSCGRVCPAVKYNYCQNGRCCYTENNCI